MKYCRKPVEVEAVQWFKDGDHPEVMMDRQASLIRFLGRYGPPVYPGDWIVKDETGLHKKTPAEFAAEYEEVKE